MTLGLTGSALACALKQILLLLAVGEVLTLAHAVNEGNLAPLGVPHYCNLVQELPSTVPRCAVAFVARVVNVFWL